MAVLHRFYCTFIVNIEMSELSTGIKLELSDREKFDCSYKEVLAKILNAFIQAFS